MDFRVDQDSSRFGEKRQNVLFQLLRPLVAMRHSNSLRFQNTPFLLHLAPIIKDFFCSQTETLSLATFCGGKREIAFLIFKGEKQGSTRFLEKRITPSSRNRWKIQAHERQMKSLGGHHFQENLLPFSFTFLFSCIFLINLCI